MWVSSSPIFSRSVLKCCGQISRGISPGYSRYMEDCRSRRTTCVSKRRDLSLRRPRYELPSFPRELFDSKYDLNSWYSPSATSLPLNYREPSDSDPMASSSSSKTTKSYARWEAATITWYVCIYRWQLCTILILYVCRPTSCSSKSSGEAPPAKSTCSDATPSVSLAPRWTRWNPTRTPSSTTSAPPSSLHPSTGPNGSV